ncbi:MAG: hypothetical protein J5937_04520 [Paludibacteraceae bacterium]|nr:hypothetical protein [Paludibacteraceae bacterium]
MKKEYKYPVTIATAIMNLGILMASMDKAGTPPGDYPSGFPQSPAPKSTRPF